MSPQAPGLWARVLVRALVVVAAGVMALGFLGPEAALLVAFLTVLTYVLLWARSRYAGFLFVDPGPDPGPEPPEDPATDPDGQTDPPRGPRPRNPPD
ncbi:hypothetical protein NE857_04425 [Nocardiopsis exhalans]|uniref:Uncharacterized protein n=1 Tax=Nocardiopsis exhalans TaxID=163604 RepID=A0ABY5DBZ8_9ACTN|nr:hypothetical protein [Nocardiopsis exhalans]USY20905.1 hypothetical protein NE857_04425 [Nocardiopsis exhalans]